MRNEKYSSANIDLIGSKMTEALNSNDSLARRIQDSLCTVDELESLLGTSVEVDRLIASSKRAGSDTLKKLSRSADDLTRECVTGNPNTSLELLNNLADEYPRAFLLNPAFDLIVLENPGFLENLYESTLAKILEQRECPQSIVVWAYNFYKKKSSFSSIILKGVVKNPHTPVKMINAILRLDTGLEITCEEGFL
jgi:hypothetical protein